MKLIEQVAPHQLFKIELTADEAADLIADLNVSDDQCGLEPATQALFRFLKERIDV